MAHLRRAEGVKFLFLPLFGAAGPHSMSFYKNSIKLCKNFSVDRAWGQTNPWTPIVSQAREKEKVKARSHKMLFKSEYSLKWQESKAKCLKMSKNILKLHPNQKCW